jgi:hypothetical protein
MEVHAGAGKSFEVDLVYSAGAWERVGLVLSTLTLIVWAGTARRRL